MWYLLVFWTLTGEIVSEDMWSMKHKFFTLEQCTAKKIQNQRVIDKAWFLEGADKRNQLTFECRLGPELLAQS